MNPTKTLIETVPVRFRKGTFSNLVTADLHADVNYIGYIYVIWNTVLVIFSYYEWATYV